MLIRRSVRRFLAAVVFAIACACASPAAAQPPASPPPVRLRIESAEPGLAAHTWAGTAVVSMYRSGVHPAPVYAPLCAAPCTTFVAPGARLAFSQDGGIPIEPDAPVSITRPAVLKAEYTSRADLRAAGIVTFLAGAGGGSALMLTAKGNGTVDQDQLIGGAFIVLVSAVVGTALWLQRDSVSLTVLPLELGDRREGAFAPDVVEPRGAVVALRF